MAVHATCRLGSSSCGSLGLAAVLLLALMIGSASAQIDAASYRGGAYKRPRPPVVCPTCPTPPEACTQADVEGALDFDKAIEAFVQQQASITADDMEEIGALLPEWGNWCGLEKQGPNPPVDQIDNCCKAHDQCYKEQGQHACACDRALWLCLFNLQRISNSFTLKQTFAQTFIQAYLSQAPCASVNGGYCRIKRGVQTCDV